MKNSFGIILFSLIITTLLVLGLLSLNSIDKEQGPAILSAMLLLWLLSSTLSLNKLKKSRYFFKFILIIQIILTPLNIILVPIYVFINNKYELNKGSDNEKN